MEEIATDTALAERIRLLTGKLFDEAEIQAVELHALNLRKDTPVYRVALTDANGLVSNIIAKQLCIPQAALDFTPEVANYIFLQMYRERFDRFPDVLVQEADLMLLEDLGPDKFIFKTRNDIIEALADTFARLHTAFTGMEKEYAAVRATFDLPETQDEPRRNSEGGRQIAATRGAAAISDYIALMGICERETIYAQLQECIDFVADKESPMRTFVHDDVADRRQTIVKDGIVYLIDFEHGKYHHALMDLAKLLIGKIEHDGLKNGMFYNHPQIPVTLAAYYRRRRVELGATDPGDADWNLHLANAMIVQLLLMVGRALEMSGHKFVDPLAMIIRDIIRRLQLQLEGNDARKEVMGFLGKLQERILV